MYTITVLSSADLPLLLNASEDVFDNPVDEALAREFLNDPRHHIVAAIAEGRLVGFASGMHYIHPDKPPELWINEVGVAPSHQGQGIGRAIMKGMLELGRELGCKNAWVLTDRGNEPANRLYRSAGGKIGEEDTLMYEFKLTGEWSAMSSGMPRPSGKLDLRTTVEIPIRQFAWWLIMVLIVTIAGYPGVVCVTPMAWLVALRVGNQVAWRSKSGLRSQRLTEAALAGGSLGFLQGVLFGVVVPFMGPIQPDEMANSILLMLFMLVVGTLAGAGLSFFTAFLNENRRKA